MSKWIANSKRLICEEKPEAEEDEEGSTPGRKNQEQSQESIFIEQNDI